MPKPFSVSCPNCEARLKIQNPKAIGKKVRCPNCENPFVVKAPRPSAPPQDDFALEDDYDDYDDYEEDFGPPKRSSRRATPSRSARGPARGPAPARGRKPKGKSRKKKSNANLPLIIGGALASLLLMGGMGFLVYALVGGSAVDYAWLPPESEMVISIKVDDVWNSGFVNRMRNGVNGEDFRRQTEQMEKELKDLGFQDGESLDAIESFTAGFQDSDRKDGLAVVRKKTPWNQDVIKEKKRGTEETRNGQTYYASFNDAFFFPDENTLVVGSKNAIEAAIDRGPESNVGEKFSFLPKGQVVIGFLPNNREKFTRELAIPPLFALMLGNKDYIKDINEGLQTVQGGAVVVEVGGGVEVDVLANCANSDAAGKLSRGINDALADFRTSVLDKEREKAQQKSEPERQAFELGESVFQTISASQSGENVTLSMEVSSSVIDRAEQLDKERGGKGSSPLPTKFFDVKDLFGGFGGGGRPGGRPGDFGGNPFTQAGEARDRVKDRNNLKQIGLALHNYYDTFRSLPPAQGKGTGLSWRVHILPYVEQAPLYQQFKLDEPWNSPHNMRLVNQMPDVFRRPGSNAGPGKTTYLGVAGPGGMMENGGGKRFQDVTDGLSNTAMVVEVEDHAAVIWTQPDEYEINPNDPKQDLGGWNGGFHALYGDGSVRFLAKNMNAQTLLDILQRNDGHPPSF